MQSSQIKPHSQNNPGIIPNPKRLVMTVGDARVGKSTTARLLIEFYLESQLNLRVYYSGNRIPRRIRTLSLSVSSRWK